MVIYHTDKAGQLWRFGVGCSYAQAGTFARLLRDISRVEVRRRGPVPRKRTATEKANAEFCARLERELLEALAARFPVPEEYEHKEIFAL